MDLLDKRTICVLTTICAFVAVGAFIYGARHVLIAFLLAILFAYLLEPLVSHLQAWTHVSRGSRNIAILEVYGILCAAVALMVWLGGGKIINEGRTLANALPGLFENLTSGQFVLQIGSTRGWSHNTQAELQRFIADHRSTLLRWANASLGYLAALAQNAIWIVLIPILAIFFLKDGRAFTLGVLDLVEGKHRKQFVSEILEDLNEMLAHYIRSQLILAGLALVAYIAFLSLLRVPYAAALGAVAGLLEFIPVVGPLIGAAAILGVAFLTNYPHLLPIVAFLAIWRGVQDYVTQPRVMGGKLELHPLAIIFAVLVGGEIAGVIGVYLSIPIAATVRILWRGAQRCYPADKTDIRAA